MNPLLAALVAAGVIDRAEAERINRLLNDDLRRTWAEQQIAAATARALRAQQQRLATAAGEGGAPALVQESLWRSEDRQLAQAVLPSLRSVAGDAAIVASVRSGLDAWQATNTGVIDWVNQYYTGAAGDALGSIPSLNRVTREEVGRLVNLWQTGDLPGGPQLGLPDLIASMESSFGAERGARIAVTETTRVFAESTRAAAIANPTVTMLRWGTARDEIVCFPAGTLVTTEVGDVPIERIAPGQRVMTRSGLRRVSAVSVRDYSGEMVTLETESGVRLTSTANHPIWSEIAQTWLEASQFEIGDTVQLLNHKSDRIGRVLKFALGDTNDRPSLPPKVLLLRCVAAGGMPVSAIDFNGNAAIRDREVNAVASYAELLSELDSGRSERFTHASFEQRFGLRSAIAGKTTELARRRTGFHSESLAARLTRDVHRRAAAFFGTEALFPSLLARHEYLAAAFAGSLFSPVSAFPAAHSVAMRDTRLDRELLLAYRADFRNHYGGGSIVPARSAAIVPLAIQLSAGQWLAALFAHPGRGSTNRVVAGLRAILLACLRRCRFEWRSTERTLSDFQAVSPVSNAQPMTTLYHEWRGTETVRVYDLQVEDVPEFYANGILVHNCPICGPFDGQTITKYQRAFPGGYFPPAHPNCRCDVTEETAFTMNVPLGIGGAGTWTYGSS